MDVIDLIAPRHGLRRVGVLEAVNSVCCKGVATLRTKALVEMNPDQLRESRVGR